jgi:hypothetical protein
MSTQHTPGPWFKNRGFLIGSDGSDVVAADLGLGLGADNGDGIRKANARLIIAAPDLLEALQDLFDADMEHFLMGDGKDDQIEAIAKARAAIAKATGETK